MESMSKSAVALAEKRAAYARRRHLPCIWRLTDRPSHHYDLRRVAPGAHAAFDAGGADVHPEGGAGDDAAQDGFAAAGEAGVFPVGIDVRVAGAGLDLAQAG